MLQVTSFQTLSLEETLCLTLNAHGPIWKIRKLVCTFSKRHSLYFGSLLEKQNMIQELELLVPIYGGSSLARIYLT